MSERSEPSGTTDAADQTPGPAGNAAADECAGGADRVCDDDEVIDAIADGDAVNCGS